MCIQQDRNNVLFDHYKSPQQYLKQTSTKGKNTDQEHRGTTYAHNNAQWTNDGPIKL